MPDPQKQAQLDYTWMSGSIPSFSFVSKIAIAAAAARPHLQPEEWGSSYKAFLDVTKGRAYSIVLVTEVWVSNRPKKMATPSCACSFQANVHSASMFQSHRQ